MSNKNFGEPWQGKIERIRENLREGRYAIRGGIFPIVKELIQNAEDARATRLMICWDPGLVDAEHPLLQGPGILAINNGYFDSANGRAIREMGLSSKTADSSSIGKFGLGMKSVFHLGEVFFFVAVDESGKRFDADVRSPWSTDDGGLHPEWDDFEKHDQILIEKRVRSLFGSGRWFCLWVPLRTETNCGNVGPIESYYPGSEAPQNLLGNGHFEQVAAILPLLTNLNLVQFRASNQNHLPNHEIGFSPDSARRPPLGDFNTESEGTLTPFEGQLACQNVNAGELLHYSGLDCRLNDEKLNLLSKDEAKKWPRRFATNTATGQSEQVREKASQHAAACFIARPRPTGRAQLRIHWAVFLPLGHPETLDIDAAGWDLDLILHGWFFPNSGRTEIEGLNQEPPDFESLHDSAAVRQAWNHRLAQFGTLPLLLRAYAAIVRRCGWKDSVIGKVTAAIQRSVLYSKFRTDICRRDALVKRITNTGKFEWRVVKSSKQILCLPDSKDELAPATVFPALRSIADKFVIVRRTSPRITPPAAETPWPKEVVQELLKSVTAADLINDRSHCEYFYRFLEIATDQPITSMFADELVAVTRSALSAALRVATTEAYQLAEQIIKQAPLDRCIRLSLDIADEMVADLYEALCESGKSIVWVPDRLLADECECRGALEAPEASSTLRTLCEWGNRNLTSAQADRVGIVAAQVFRASSELELVLKAAGDLMLFTGINCRERKELRFSWRQIFDHHRQRELFIKPSPMAYRLQDALANDSLMLISKELVDVLFIAQADTPSQCREGQMLAALTVKEKPELSEPDQRRDLFEAILKFAGGRREPLFPECVRFLLHGKKGCFAATEPLLVQADAGNDIWWRMVKNSVTALGQQWRIVDQAFSTILSAEDRREFAIHVGDSEVAEELAKLVDPEKFRSLRPTAAEYAVLLRHISDDGFLKRLPIHEDVEDQFVSIDENTVVQGDVALPAEFQKSIRLLKRACDEQTWKRQLQLAAPLDAGAIINVVLSQPESSRHWSLIMESLSGAGRLPEKTERALKNTRWLPLMNGGAAKPEDVLYLPQLKDHVARLVTEYPGVYYDSEALSPALRAHNAFGTLLSEIVPQANDALVMLGTLLLEDERNAVGNAEVSFEEWLLAFQSEDGGLFPHFGLLRGLSAELPNVAKTTFDVLRIPVNEDRTRELLAFLKAAHIRERSSPRRQTIIRVFGQYSRQLLVGSDFKKVIYEIDLPAADGGWRPSRELCFANDGIAPSVILDRQIEEQFDAASATVFPKDGPAVSGRENVDDTPTSKEPDWNVSGAAERLRGYFASWRDLVPHEHIGGFLSLLGEDEGVRKLAQEYLGRNRTLDETREKFGLPEVQCGRDSSGQPLMEDAHTLIRKQRVVVEIADEPNVPVLNIFGEEINVPRNNRPLTLFVGYGSKNNPFPHRMVDSQRIRCFRLNIIDPNVFTESELSDLLRGSASKFIGEAYNVFESQTQFATTWDELGKSDQLDIRITQSRIIEHGFLILDQYGLRSDPELARVLDRWDAAERLKGEIETLSSDAKRRHSRDPIRELDKAREDLRRLFEEPPTTDTQSHVLNAIQHRIADHYQYNISSIPFELFQNADDAYAELNLFFPEPSAGESRPSPTSIISWQAGRVVFIHFGRRINQYPVDTNRSEHGFDNDLWKMSVLSLSNKGISASGHATTVTGKFGLGFKSVFLACNCPRLLSGRLAFEFVGGIYPRRLIGDERRRLDALRESSGYRNPQATIIDLQLRDNVDAAQVIQRFQSLAHILVVFARQIRHCVCGDAGAETQWQPKAVPGVPGCYAGELKPLTFNRDRSESHRALLFQSEAGALLFALSSRGIAQFAPEIPTVWVTAPTEEELKLGFLVNGPFALDVGRAQLARDPIQNHQLALQLGQSFSQQLTLFFQSYHAPSQMKEIRSTLGFAADATPCEMWNTLWDGLVLAVSERTSNDQPADQLIRSILWQSADSGVARFYSNCEAVPVSLPGPQFESTFVSLSSARFAIRGVLIQRERRPELDGVALACVTSWPTFQDRIGTGRVVSHDRVIKPLEKLCPSLVLNVTSVSLADVLSWECPYTMVAPEAAERFGELLTRDFISSVADPLEAKRIREFLDVLEFKAADGLYHPATELLIGCVPSSEGDWSVDECQRSMFAPRSKILSDEYGKKGLRFFVASRVKLSVPSREMVSWVRDAVDDAKRKAALAYLADGDLGRELQSELIKQGLDGTWLSDLTNSSAFLELPAAQQHRLAGLFTSDESANLLGDLFRSVPDARILDPATVLKGIHDWWVAEGSRYIREYEESVYPNGGLSFLVTESDDHSHQRRKDWVTLLLIGLTHTMGRTVAEQHRNFLRQCEQQGRLDMIARPERQPEPWMRWIEVFLDDQVDDNRFLQWMKQFVGIYQVSRHLDDYIELFLAVQRFQRPFALTQLTNSRSSAYFQAGGITAPPLSRVLGMGQCFVLRELHRKGVLSNPYAHPHCFVPVGRVRRMLIELGCDELESRQKPWEWSRNIFAFLQQHLGSDAATFGGAFDIPLQVVAGDLGLQNHFFQSPIRSDDDETALWFDADTAPQTEDN